MDGIECRSYSSPVNGTTSRHQARFAYKGGNKGGNKSTAPISQLRRENSEKSFRWLPVNGCGSAECWWLRCLPRAFRALREWPPLLSQ